MSNRITDSNRGPVAGGEGRRQASNLRSATFASLNIPAFRWLWLSSLAAYSAMGMMQLSQGFLIYDLTGSTVNLGLVMVAFGVPIGIFAPIAGVVTDRVDKVKVISAAIAVNILMALYIGVLVLLDRVNMANLMVSGAVSGTALAFNMPGRMALVRELVGTDRLLNAVSLNTGAMNLTRIIAPAMAGYIIALFSRSGVFFVIAGLYLLALVSLLPIGRQIGQGQRRKSVLLDMKEGFTFVRSTPNVMALLLVGFVASVLGMNYQNLMPAFAKDSLGLEAGGLGLLYSFTGIGALAGSLVMASLGNYQGKGRLLLLSVIAWGTTIFLFSMSQQMSLALFFLILVGLSQSAFMAVHMVLVQMNTAVQMQGRVMSLLTMTIGLMPLGVIPISFLAEARGTAFALGVSAILMAVFGVFLTLFASRLRSLA